MLLIIGKISQNRNSTLHGNSVSDHVENLYRVSENKTEKSIDAIEDVNEY